MALSYNLGYQESISVHPTRRQNFAGKVYSNFPNIWEWLIYARRIWKISCLCFSCYQTNPSEYLKSSMSSSSAYKHISVFFLWFSFFHRSIWLCYELSISVCHLMLHKSIFLCFSFSCTKASGCVVSKTIWHLELLFCGFPFLFSKPSVFSFACTKASGYVMRLEIEF